VIGPFEVFETDLPLESDLIHFHHKAKESRNVWVTPKYNGQDQGWLVFNHQKPQKFTEPEPQGKKEKGS
jgi:hypothetical protein